MKNEKYISREEMNSLIQGNQVTDSELDQFFTDFEKKGYIIEGYNEPKPSKTSQAISEGIDKAKQGIKSTIQTAQDIGSAVNAPTLGEGTAQIVKGTIKGTGEALGTAGGVVGSVLNVADQALTGGKVGETIGGITRNVIEGAGKVGQTLDFGGVLAKADPKIAQFLQDNPEVAYNLNNYAEGLNLLGVKPSLNVAKQVGQTAVKAGESAIKATGETGKVIVDKARNTIANYQKAKTPEDVFAKVKTNLQEQIEGRKALNKPLDKTRTDIFDTIAKDPRYYPDIDVENKSFNTKLAVSNLNNDISEIAEATRGLFRNADIIDGGVKIEDVTKELQKNILNKDNAIRYVIGGQNVFSDIQPLLERAKQIYGDIIPREAIWDIRKSVDDAIEKLSDTNLKKGIRQDLRKAFATSLEDSIKGDKKLVKTAMTEMQKRIEARDYLQGALSEAKLQGGKLTDLIRNFTTSTISSALASGVGGVAGGVGGAIIGYAGSQAIGKWLAKNILTSARDRKVLKEFVKDRPQVLDDIEEYIKSVSKEEADNINNNLLKAGLK